MKARLLADATELLTVLSLITCATLLLIVVIPLSVISLVATFFSTFKRLLRKREG